jgi:DNA-binding response OmpR family regulator
MIQEPDTPQGAFPFILVLDPDPLMGDATVDLLEVSGFPAVSANRLEEAKQLLRQYHGQIRLILLTINNASAASLAYYAFLKTHCAHLALICLAPNRSDGLRRHLGLAPEAPLLHLRTPYKADALWAVVRQTLADQA